MSRHPRLPLRLTVLSLALSCTLALADTAVSLSGRVVSAGTHRPVVGLRVLVKETGAQALTDGDGAYQIVGLAAGRYTLEVDSDGTERAHAEVTVAAANVSQDFELDAAASRLQTVEVLAQRAPQVLARSAQQDAPNMVNLTTAEEIRKLPDVSAAEALQRLPGVTLTYDTGEARYTVIRGLSSDFNAVTFGGLRLPPTDTASPSQGRAVAMDVIPAGLIGALTVTKTTLPEQDAEAIGGTIDITPKTAPLSGKTFIEGHIGTGRETLRNTGITDLSLTAGTRFGLGSSHADSDSSLQAWSDRPFSVVGTATYYEDKRGVDDAEEAYQIDSVPAGTAISPKAFNSFEQRWYQYHRARKAFGLDLGYQPDANNAWYLRAFTSGYTENVERQRLIWNFAGNATFPDANGNFADQATGWDKTLRDHQERVSERVIALGGKHQIDDKVLDYRLGYTRGQDEGLYDRNTRFSYTPANPVAVSYNNGNANYPSFSLPAGVNPFDAAASPYLLNKLSDQQFTVLDQEKAISANLKLPTHWTDFDGESIKVGVNARMRTRDNPGNTGFAYKPAALDLTGFQGSPGGLGFYDGHYNNGPQISIPATAALYGTNSPYFSSASVDPASMLSAAEDVYAGYGQYNFGFGKWSFVGGARMEATRAKYTGNVIDAVSGSYAANTVGHAYNNFFPSLQARYEYTSDLIARAAVSTNIARPTFNQVNATTLIDTGALTISTGNPNLSPTTALNFDLALEQYLPHGGILSVSLFDKEFNNYIIQSASHPVINGSIYLATSYANDSGSSYARGLELNYEQRYTMLPGLLSGLGTSANYTFVDSRFQIRPGESSQLPLAARNTANLAVFYEKSGLNLRLAAYYVGRNLFAPGGNASQDNFAEARTLVDLGASYALDPHFSLYANVKNLTNEPLKYSEGSSDRLIQREFYGVTLQAGVNINY